MLNYIFMLAFFLSTLHYNVSGCSVWGKVFNLFIFLSKILVCLCFKGCVVLSFDLMENWDNRVLVIKMQNQGRIGNQPYTA